MKFFWWLPTPSWDEIFFDCQRSSFGQETPQEAMMSQAVESIIQGIIQKHHIYRQEIPFSRKFHRLSTQSDVITSRDFQHIGKSLRLNLLFRTSQLRNFHNQENPMGIDNNSEDSFCCANANSTDDPRQFGELFTHGRVGEDGHTKSHLGDILYSMNIWRVLYLANLSFWKFHGY